MSRRAPILTLAAALLLSACGEEKVSVYQVPREADPELPASSSSPSGPADAAQGPATMAGTAVPTAQGSDLLWTAPADWTPRPASAMRKASYALPGGAELSVTAFPGDVGGELANVNRWRGQVGFPALSPESLEGSVSRFESGGLKFTLVELIPGGGSAAKAMVGAIVPFGDGTWFFKVSGTAGSVGAAKPAFVSFLRTVRAP